MSTDAVYALARGDLYALNAYRDEVTLAVRDPSLERWSLCIEQLADLVELRESVGNAVAALLEHEHWHGRDYEASEYTEHNKTTPLCWWTDTVADVAFLAEQGGTVAGLFALTATDALVLVSRKPVLQIPPLPASLATRVRALSQVVAELKPSPQPPLPWTWWNPTRLWWMVADEVDSRFMRSAFEVARRTGTGWQVRSDLLGTMPILRELIHFCARRGQWDASAIHDNTDPVYASPLHDVSWYHYREEPDETAARQPSSSWRRMYMLTRRGLFAGVVLRNPSTKKACCLVLGGGRYEWKHELVRDRDENLVLDEPHLGQQIIWNALDGPQWQTRRVVEYLPGRPPRSVAVWCATHGRWKLAERRSSDILPWYLDRLTWSKERLLMPEERLTEFPGVSDRITVLVPRRDNSILRGTLLVSNMLPASLVTQTHYCAADTPAQRRLMHAEATKVLEQRQSEASVTMDVDDDDDVPRATTTTTYHPPVDQRSRIFRALQVSASTGRKRPEPEPSGPAQELRQLEAYAVHGDRSAAPDTVGLGTTREDDRPSSAKRRTRSQTQQQMAPSVSTRSQTQLLNRQQMTAVSARRPTGFGRDTTTTEPGNRTWPGWDDDVLWSEAARLTAQCDPRGWTLVVCPQRLATLIADGRGEPIVVAVRAAPAAAVVWRPATGLAVWAPPAVAAEVARDPAGHAELLRTLGGGGSWGAN